MDDFILVSLGDYKKVPAPLVVGGKEGESGNTEDLGGPGGCG